MTIPQRCDKAKDSQAGAECAVDDTARRSSRWRLRDRANIIGLQAVKRVAECGRAIATRVALISAVDGGHAKGVATCGSVWSCPVCAPVIRQTRAAQQAEAITRWDAEGGRIFFVTYTIAHDAGESLEQVRAALMATWSTMRAGRARAQIRAELVSIGEIRAFDVTHGTANGWHPHFHCVYFCGPKTSVADVENCLLPRWIAAAAVNGRDVVRAALDVQPVYAGDQSAVSVAMYAMKAGMEMFRMDLKRSGSGDSPWQFLAGAMDESLTGDERFDCGALWAEYATTMHSKRAAQWSKELVAWFGDIGDEEDLAEGTLVDPVVVGFIAAGDWNQLRRVPGATALIIEAIAAGRLAMVCADLRVALQPPDTG